MFTNYKNTKSQFIPNDSKLFWGKKVKVSFLLSILVFFIHISSLANYPNTGNTISRFNQFMDFFVTEGFTRIAVPSFFIISGATFFRNFRVEIYTTKLKSRIKTLVIPYLLWNIIYLLFNIITSYTFVSRYFIGREKFDISPLNILNAIFHHGCNGHFWFVFELIIFIIFSPLIYYIIKNKIIATLFICFATFGVINGITVPYISEEGWFYFILGAFLGMHHFDIFSSRASLKVQIISGVLLLAQFAINLLKCYEIFILPYRIYYLIFAIGAIAFWFVTDGFIYKLKQRDFFNESFLIYAIHGIVSPIITKLAYLLMPKSNFFYLVNLCITITFVLISTFFFKVIMTKVMPKTYRLLIGNR